MQALVGVTVFPAWDPSVVLAVGNDQHFTALREVLGAPDDSRFQTNTLRVLSRMPAEYPTAPGSL